MDPILVPFQLRFYREYFRIRQNDISKGWVTCHWSHLLKELLPTLTMLDISIHSCSLKITTLP